MTDLEKYYNKFNEDHRLTTRHGKVEFEVSMKFIREFIGENKSARILDIGAGTGRYSVKLSQEGYDVTAVELVKRNFEILQGKHSAVKCWQGNALNLHFLQDETFDITILFGPLYHLQTKEEKLKAFEEAKRVTKKGGIIFAGYVMNEYAVLTYCFKEQHILECMENKTLTDDFHCLTSKNDLYSYLRLEDIDELKNLSGLKREKIFAPDGSADFLRRELNALDEESFQMFIKYQMAVCQRPELLGASSHVVDVLRKV